MNSAQNTFYIFSMLVALVSCSESKEKKGVELTSRQIILNAGPLKVDFGESSDRILNEWVSYYKSNEPGFSLNHFNLEKTDTLSFIQGNVLGNFDDNFDEVYADFIVFNRAKDKYIDFDSYQWELADDKSMLFSPDQEINLIDINAQTVTRIGFMGSLQWAEDAFWENDSTVVLLGNSDDKIPFIREIDLNSRVEKTFRYSDSLNFKSKYPELRFKKKGLKYEF